MSVDAPATLQQAAERYLHHLSHADAASKTVALKKFVEFVGPSAVLQQLVPHQVASYGESLDAAMTNTQTRVEPVKDFLKYAHKKGWTTINLASHIKVRSGRRANGAAAPKEPTRIKLTPDGMVRLQAELEDLKSRLPQLAEAITVAAADKDFRENQPFHAAREDKAKVDSRIRELEAQLGLADVIEDGLASADRVSLGRSILVHDQTYNETFTWTIVSPSEVDPRAGRISAESPAGKALLDRSPGEEVEVQTPGGKVKYRVVEIVTTTTTTTTTTISRA